MVEQVVFSAQPSTPEAPAPQQAPRPEHIPEKFWDAEKGAPRVEDLAKSYLELEKKLATPKEAQEPEKKPEQQAPKQDNKAVPESMKELQKSVTDKGLDFHKFYDEYNEKGDLSQESFQALEQQGFTKEFISEYIAGQEALAHQTVAEVQSIFGGEEGFQQAVQWATANLPAEEIERINSVIQRGNLNEIKTTYKALKSDILSARGNPPNLIKGGNAPQVGPGYASREQMVADMRNPLYKKDPAFRDQVAQKIARSSF